RGLDRDRAVAALVTVDTDPVVRLRVDELPLDRQTLAPETCRLVVELDQQPAALPERLGDVHRRQVHPLEIAAERDRLADAGVDDLQRADVRRWLRLPA